MAAEINIYYLLELLNLYY